MKRSVGRTLFVLFLVGAFVSAQQARCEESVFSRDTTEAPDELTVLAVPADAGPSVLAGARLHSMPTDTVETYDIELEEDDGPGLKKEIAMFVIVAAVVGYMIATLIMPDDEEDDATDGGSGKPTPSAAISIPLPVIP